MRVEREMDAGAVALRREIAIGENENAGELSLRLAALTADTLEAVIGEIAEDRVEWQSKLEEAQALDHRLQAVQEGHHEGAEGGDRDYRILTPWKSPEARPKGWDPDIDDGVKVNIEPLRKAGVLRIGKVV